jgi:hypothetical protein
MEHETSFSEIMNHLLRTAENDGNVTTEEFQFLGELQEKVDNYEKFVYEAQQDNFISDDEFHELVILRDSILNAALDFQTESEDINVLVQQLFDEINNFVIPGMEDDETPLE